METIHQSSRYYSPRMSNNHNRWSKLKQSHFPKSKYFHFGGNRKDPLNLNELIQKKKQSTEINIYGNDRPVEILLQPNIFDPLCLDISSYSDKTNEYLVIQKSPTNLQQVPESTNQY